MAAEKMQCLDEALRELYKVKQSDEGKECLFP